MSPAEVSWRTKCALRDQTDRLFLARRQRGRPLSAILAAGDESVAPGFRVSDMRVGEWAGDDPAERQQLERLLERADRIAEHRLTFFDLVDRHLGSPIDWNRDHKLNKSTPVGFAPSIDYRDVRLAGDCKFVWEPSRHHQLVVLGRAYRAGGDIRFAEAIVEQLDSWMNQCPYGTGMQWRSPLELGIRLINWVWAVDLIRESGLVTGEFAERLLNAVYRHVWEVARRFSYGSSSNNHVIGEAAGVFVAASYFSDLKGAARWRARSRRRLYRELLAQTCDDGGDREQAIGYHLFVVQFFLLAGLVARWTGEDFPTEYWQRLEKMFEFLGVLSEGGRSLPMFGDADDGYVLDLGDDPRNVREWLAVGAVLFDRPDLKAWAGRCAEPVRWLLGRTSPQRFDILSAPQADAGIVSRDLPRTGYYLLQCGCDRERISVVFDCGELGLGSLAGHGHADALSFTLRAFGEDVLVDPGTYDYFTYRQWREYFRSTRAHNTVVMDGQDQSVMQGLFLWGRRANARCLAWKPLPEGGEVTGEHDGYTRLADPVRHRRTLELDGRQRRLVVRDEILAAGEHDVAVYFHLGEHCHLETVEPGRFRVQVGAGSVTIGMDPQLSVDALTGSEDPIAGWVSRGYHQRVASTTLVGRCRSEGAVTLNSQIDIGAPTAGEGGC